LPYKGLNNTNIGLLGGSFNPAHKGHIYVSDLALKIFNLNQVWWLVTPQNPLKENAQKGTYDFRLSTANKLKKSYKIKVLSLEYNIGTKFSYDTIKVLKKSLPNINFFWIIGADNLCDMHLWYKWKKIFRLCPVVVFNRPGYTKKALFSKTAHFFWSNKVDSNKIRVCKNYSLPLWTFVNKRMVNHSSSAIRTKKNRIINGKF